MVNISTRNKVVDLASEYFSPILSCCEDFDTFINYVHREMDNIKIDIIKKCIENFDQELRDKIPDDWTIVKRIERKIICVFGKVKFKRTLFLDQYGRYRYLCDELLGIAPKSRFSSDAFIWLMNTITKLSYGKTATAFKQMSNVKISKMAIHYMVQREAKLIEESLGKHTKPLITQESICVESDGIFVALQSPHRRSKIINRFFYEQQHHKNSFELKCACVYAGKVKENKRVRRINTKLVCGNYDADTLWKTITENIKSTYEVKNLSKIYYGSDAGSWCKNQRLDINNNLNARVIQTIDRYHVMQAIWRVFPKGSAQDWLVSLIIRRKPERFIKAMKRILPQLHGNKRSKANSLISYISNNIELVKAGFNLGTMEATNAHVWAKRMKHIGGAWSEKGGHAMAVLLAHVNSGKNPIPPKRNIYFSKADKLKEEKFLDKSGPRAGQNYIVGNGYSPPQGHVVHERAPGAFIPGSFAWAHIR